MNYLNTSIFISLLRLQIAVKYDFHLVKMLLKPKIGFIDEINTYFSSFFRLPVVRLEI